MGAHAPYFYLERMTMLVVSTRGKLKTKIDFFEFQAFGIFDEDYHGTMRALYDFSIAEYGRDATYDYGDAIYDDDSTDDQQALEEIYNGLDHKVIHKSIIQILVDFFGDIFYPNNDLNKNAHSKYAMIL